MGKWEELSIEENVNYINELLNNDKSMKEIEEECYQVGERVIVKRLARKGYKRANEGKRLFVLVGGEESLTKANKRDIEEDNKQLQKEYNKTTNQLSSDDIKAIKQLLSRVNEIEELLNNYKSSSNSEELKVHKVNKAKVRSWKVDDETLKKWDKFTKAHNLYSVSDLINSALLEYIENHSKR